MAYIYCIINQINEKKYVGKSTNSIEKRWEEHCKDSKRKRCEKRPLYDAMQKYGNENFKIELLQECDELELNSFEMFWIEKLDTYKNGYNATLGGDGAILFDYKLIIELYNSGLTVKNVAKQINCCVDTVSKVLKLYNIDGYKNSINDKSISIKQLDLNRNYIQTFNSLADAARWLVDNGIIKNFDDGIKNKLSRVARGKAKTAYKFIWEW